MKTHALITITLSLALSLSAAKADVIGERKAKFRQNVDAMKAISKAIPEGDVSTIAVAASLVAEWSKEMTAFFPEGSDQGDTKARPEIWLEWEKFEALAGNAADKALALAALAQAGNKDGLADGLNALGATCKACHNSFKY
jgi:cytochrome c556